jgi:predicted DNA-binding transcriptional regulator YafY
MSSQGNTRRRPAVHITLQRAARLHRLVRFLAGAARTRPAILSELRVGLRTFYRELELLRKCGVRVRHKQKLYQLLPTATEALGRLPFPDPQLSFAEMAELGACDCAAGRRLQELLDAVVNQPGPAKTRSRKSGRGKK